MKGGPGEKDGVEPIGDEGGEGKTRDAEGGRKAGTEKKTEGTEKKTAGKADKRSAKVKVKVKTPPGKQREEKGSEKEGPSKRPSKRWPMPLTAVGIVILLISAIFANFYDGGDAGGGGDDGDLDITKSAESMAGRARVLTALELEYGLKDILAGGAHGANRTKLEDSVAQRASSLVSVTEPAVRDPDAGLILFITKMDVRVEPGPSSSVDGLSWDAPGSLDFTEALGTDVFPRASGTPMLFGSATGTGDSGAGTALALTARAEFDYSVKKYKEGPGGDIVIKDTVLEDGGEAEVSVDSPVLLFRYLAERLEGQCGSGSGDVARTVRYILNTVARVRADAGVGNSQSESPRNILNEGDVELAVNMALILEELMLIGAYDPEAVDAMDRAVYHAYNTTANGDVVGYTPDNPTGRRQWGEAETRNFNAYTDRVDAYAGSGAGGGERTMGALLDEHVLDVVGGGKGSAKLDPADLYMRYLLYDQTYQLAEDGPADPGDNVSIISKLGLIDPRDTSVHGDHARLNQMMGILGPWEPLGAVPGGPHSGGASSGGTENTGTVGKWTVRPSASDDGADPPLPMEFAPTVTRTPSYLVAGDDFTIDGIFPPRGWFTNADISFGGTRTGGIPPPIPPVDHDYRIQWDLRVRGEYTLTIATDSAGGSLPLYGGTHSQLERTIHLDFPVTVSVWIAGQPLNTVLAFENLNTGGIVNNDWFITNDSIAYEAFSVLFWPHIREAAGVSSAALQLGGNIRTHFTLPSLAQWGVEVKEDPEWDSALEEAALDAVAGALTDERIYTAMTELVDGYISGRQVDNEYLSMLDIDGYNVTFGYFDDGSVFSMTYHAMGFQGRMDFSGFRSGAGGVTVTAYWSLDAGAAGVLAHQGRVLG